MKKLNIVLLVVIGIAGLSAQTGTRLTVWSFTDEIEDMIRKAARPDLEIDYSFTPTDQYESRLDRVLASGRGGPDIIVLESSFVRKYVESGELLDITDIYEANKRKLLVYQAQIGTYQGRVYALSWQACPGAMFYRRSLAQKYLGTDDPRVVQTYFDTTDKFLKNARLLHSRSNGSCVAVASAPGDLYYPFLGARKSPWMVNGKLIIDPVMEDYMEICKFMYNNGLEGRVGQWSEDWFAGMRDELRNNKNNKGKPLEVFSYFFPTWGLHYVLKTNTPHTSGDWAMIPGPVSWHWGGTWLGIRKNTENVSAAKEFIRLFTADDGFLEMWARDSGDLVTNLAVVDKIKGNFREPFLAGQNHYAEFAEMAKNIDGSLFQQTDYMIEDLFREAVSMYVNGEKTKAEALRDFRNQAESSLNSKKR